MELEVIGAGLGRTGTRSLKLALERLGFGPCHHMTEVFNDLPAQVALWEAAAEGRADWDAIFAGYASAVDWPTAAFVPELAAAHPQARIVLSLRDPEAWVESFLATIGPLMSDTPLPPEMQDWLRMGRTVLARNGVRPGMSREALIAAFEAHNAAVRDALPPERLLVFEARQGWAPLCAFLGAEVPDEPYPRTNDRAEFWKTKEDKVEAAAPG